MNRRRLLAIAATSTTPFAGCTSKGGEEATTSTTKVGECNSTRGDKEIHCVSTDVEILEQATDDHPAVIRFSLTNESDDRLVLSANRLQPFVYFPRLAGTSGFVVCIPLTDNDINWDVVRTRTDGCWRFLDADGNETDMDIHTGLDRLTLYPGRSHRVTHHLYYESEASGCFPDGNYNADHTIVFHDRFYDSEDTVTFNIKAGFSDGRISGLEIHPYENQGS